MIKRNCQYILTFIYSENTVCVIQNRNEKEFYTKPKRSGAPTGVWYKTTTQHDVLNLNSKSKYKKSSSKPNLNFYTIIAQIKYK